jgi:hypothetical protein
MKSSIIKCSLVLVIIFTLITVSIPTVYGHGVIYETKQLKDKNSISITLKWSSPSEKRGIYLSYILPVKGKVLHVGYTTKDSGPQTVSFEFSLASLIPPVRIVLDNNDPGYSGLFTDTKNIEAQEYIEHLHDAGIINGKSDNLFKPFDNITRAEFAVIIVKALGYKGNPLNTKGYKDINNHWAKNYMLLAVQNNIMSGYSDKTLRPNNPITLSEVSAVLSRAFTFRTVNNGIYKKLNQNKWYSACVKKMFDVGILNTSDSIYNGFNEEKRINRANCAMMVSRALTTY